MAECKFYDSVSNSCVRGPHPPCKLDDCPIVPFIRKSLRINFVYLVEAARNGEYIPFGVFKTEKDAKRFLGEVNSVDFGSNVHYSYRRLMCYEYD